MNSSVLFFFYFSEGTFGNLFDWNLSNITPIDSISREYVSETNIPTSELYGITTTSTDIYQNIINDFNAEDYLFSFEELMDIIPATVDNDASTHGQADENLDTVNNSKKISLKIRHVYIRFNL